MNKFSHREREQIVATRGREEGEKELDEDGIKGTYLQL